MTKKGINKSANIRYVAYGMIGLAILIFGYNIMNMILSNSPSITEKNEIALYDGHITGESERVDDDETDRVQDSKPTQDIEKGKPEPSVSVVGQENENAEKYFLEGKKYSQSGDYIRMNDAFQLALEYSTDYHPQIEQTRKTLWNKYVNSGLEHYNNFNYSRAIQDFRLASEIEPTNTISYEYWGTAHLAQGEMNKALIPFKKLLEIGNNPEISKYVGQIYFDDGYHKWLQNNRMPNNDIRFAMDRAIQYLQRAQEGIPEDREILSTLSNAFTIINRRDEAKKVYREGISRDQGNKYYYYNLGILELEDDKYENAVLLFSNAVELDADYEDARYNLGVAYINWGVELREKAITRGHSSEAHLSKFKNALPHLEYVAKKRTNDPVLFETLGRLYENLDRVTEAQEAFNRSDKLR